MLPQRHRLKRNADIRRVYRQGRRWRHPLLTFYAAPRTEQAESAAGPAPSRFAISVSRRVGNAVTRNRSKRLVREAIRAHLPTTVAGWDCLFVARNDLAGAAYAEVVDAVRQLFQQAHLLSASDYPV